MSRIVCARTAVAFATLSVGLAAVLAATPVRATSLVEALSLAYEKSPDLRAARYAVREADELVPQALAGFRPTLSLIGESTWKDSKLANFDSQEGFRHDYAIELRQILFQGGQVENAVDAAEALVKSARASLQFTEEEVLLAAVQSYVDVRRDIARLELAKTNETNLGLELHAVQRRFEVGEVSQTDVAQSEARLARAHAERATAESLLAASKANYVRVIGEQPEALEETPPLPELPKTLDDAVGSSLEANPVINSAKYNEISAKHAVEVELGKVMPRIDLIGRYAKATSDAQFLDSLSETSVMVRAVVPLYEAGLIHSQIRKSKEAHNRRRIEIEQARRKVVEQTVQAWESYGAAQKNVEARKVEVSANELALKGVKREAELGIRTVLDVLDAEQALLDSRVALLVAERDTYVAAYQILAAVGVLNAPTLKLPVTIYDPQTHYKLVRNKWYGWYLKE